MTLRRTPSGRPTLAPILTAVAALLALPAEALASHRDGFVFNFEQGSTAPEDWCKGAASLGGCYFASNPISQFATSPFTSRYLGEFGEETITLEGMDYLDGLATLLNRGYLGFDLILTDDWSGNTSNVESLFTVVANRATLLATSFSNIVTTPQAHPGAYPQASNPAGTGATTFSTTDDENRISVYRIWMPFSLGLPPGASCCADVVIQFSASFGPGIVLGAENAPKWGLDNVVVSSSPIPEPATGALLGLGLLALAARRRRA